MFAKDNALKPYAKIVPLIFDILLLYIAALPIPIILSPILSTVNPAHGLKPIQYILSFTLNTIANNNEY